MPCCQMRVAVVGAGAAGLAAARHLATRRDVTWVVFEQTGNTGGTWVYTDRVGRDDFGMPIQSSMYKSLKTNLPTEVMSYPDFPIVADEEYIPAKEMLDYLDKYKQHFNLEEHVKFYHHVKSIKRTDESWEVCAIYLKSTEEIVYNFDAVMICNGHYSTPHIPAMSGIEAFRGEQVHSHEYRTPDRFQDKTVLVIGAGHSARDISLEISGVAKQVILSHHLKAPITNIEFPENTLQKPDVKYCTEDSVVFQDGSTAEVDVIFYCTGYLYNLDFLHETCKITIDDNYVQPLFKHMINIELPTMCIVGLPLYVSPLAMFDLQVRYFLKTLDGSLQLPSRDEMLEDRERDMATRRAVPGYTNRKAHKMGPLQEAYCHDLCDRIGAPRLPDVVFKRFNQSLCISNLL